LASGARSTRTTWSCAVAGAGAPSSGESRRGKRIARDRSLTELDSRLLSALVLGLTSVVRAKRAVEVGKVLAGLAAEDETPVVRDTARWLVARLGGALGEQLPPIPPDPPDWPILVPMAFNEALIPVLDRYLVEGEAAAARHDLDAQLDSMPRKRLAPAPPARTEARSVGRNDPCPCGSGKKYKRCCGR
jgi:hypothetical protein